MGIILLKMIPIHPGQINFSLVQATVIVAGNDLAVKPESALCSSIKLSTVKLVNCPFGFPDYLPGRSVNSVLPAISDYRSLLHSAGSVLPVSCSAVWLIS